MTLPERFWAKVDKSGDCWVWTGAVTASGYGKTSIGGKQGYVHRLAYEASAGPISTGLVIDHRCHQRTCVNPEHLQAVTPTLNAQNRAGAQVNSRSGIRGVHPFGDGWRVQVKGPDGRIHSGGVWDSLEHADAAAHNLRMDLMTNNLADDF